LAFSEASMDLRSLTDIFDMVNSFGSIGGHGYCECTETIQVLRTQT
jgi:hypothetical protein